VLRAWDEHLAHPRLPRVLPSLLRDAGFTLRRAEIVPVMNLGYARDTYSANVLGTIADFVPGRQGITLDEVDEWRDDLRSLGDDYFFSLNRYLFVAEVS